MATIINPRVRPDVAQDHRAPSRLRTAGIAIAVVGLTMSTVAFFANLAAAGDASLREGTLPWTFGLTTLGFGTVKLAIGVILWGILMKMWLRVDAVKATLGSLVDVQAGHIRTGEIETDQGSATVTATAPDELAIHRMAKAMWRPMLAMGMMAVAAGFVISLFWASSGSIAAAAWTQGLQFLGEGMLLSGIAFLLGTVLWAIRTGGGEVQEGLGAAVKTLVMPTTAKVFVGLMMAGLMLSMAQFAGYLVVATGGVDPAAWLAFLGPLREVALGLILAGITMALITIGNVLRFQFDRIVELLRTGK
jgi:hypothetical protein